MTKEAVNEKIPPKRGDLQNTHRKKFRNKHTLDASAQLQDFPSEVPEEESDSTTSVTPASSLQSSAVPCAVNLWIAPLCCLATTPIGVSRSLGPSNVGNVVSTSRRGKL